MLLQKPLIEIGTGFVPFSHVFLFNLVEISVWNLLVDVLDVSSIAHFERTMGVLDQRSRWFSHSSGVGDIKGLFLHEVEEVRPVRHRILLIYLVIESPIFILMWTWENQIS